MSRADRERNPFSPALWAGKRGAIKKLAISLPGSPALWAGSFKCRLEHDSESDCLSHKERAVSINKACSIIQFQDRAFLPGREVVK